MSTPSTSSAAERAYTAEYLAYCAAHGRTPEAQMAFDKKRFPGGCMCGFICWVSDVIVAFRTTVPGAFIGRFVANHDAKVAFMRTHGAQFVRA